MNATTTTNFSKGLSYMRLTVHLNGPSVQFDDPIKEYKTVSDDGRKIKNKKRIMNTLTFENVWPSEATRIISDLRVKYPHLEKSNNMPDGIKWYLSRMK